MKKILLAVPLFFLTVSGPLSDAFALCLVTSSRDYQPCSEADGAVALLACRIREMRRDRGTLRYQVEREYLDQNTVENRLDASVLGTCFTGDDRNPMDEWLGFEQAILFATDGWNNPATPQNESWRNASGGFIDINTIPLVAPISFQNRYDNVVVGNWTLTTPPESAFDYIGSGDMSYGERLEILNMFPENYWDYGSVTIDGKSNLPENQSPFVCGVDNTKPVILRNLVILTNGVSRSEFFVSNDQQKDCLRDGGDVFVCGGDVDDTRQVGAAGWCVEETTPVVEDCDDPGEDDEDGNGEANCDDEACQEEPICKTPVEDCSTTDVDEDRDGWPTCGDPDCDDEPVCQVQVEDCDDPSLTDEDEDGFSNCEDLIDCCSAANCASQPACQPPVVPEAGNCADDTDNDGDALTDCLDTTDCCSDAACVAHEACQIVVTPEDCTDGVSNDDDILIDCLDPDCAGHSACVIIPPEVENCTNGVDDDGDTKIDCLDTYCFTHDACQVIATEAGYCNDTLDNDGDGATDCADSDCSGLDSCQVTGGGDGICRTLDIIDYFNARQVAASSIPDCSDPDCALLLECQESVFPEAGHCADGIDNDDDGQTDCNDSACSGSADCVGGPSEAEAGHCTDGADNDSDGALDCNDTDCASDTLCVCLFDPNCTVPDYSDDNIDDDGDGFAVNGGDCNDKASAIHPAETERCDDDEIDDDCDGVIDETCQGAIDVDDDKDGFCESAVSCQGNAQPGDCDDYSDQINPGESEICDDDIDNNCDGREGTADDLEGVDLDSDDDSEGDQTPPVLPSLMRLARQGVPVITIEDPADPATDPLQPAIDPACEISIPEEKGEGGGGCGCDLSGRNSPSRNPLVWFPFILIPLGLLLRLRASKKERPTPILF